MDSLEPGGFECGHSQCIGSRAFLHGKLGFLCPGNDLARRIGSIDGTGHGNIEFGSNRIRVHIVFGIRPDDGIAILKIDAAGIIVRRLTVNENQPRHAGFGHVVIRVCKSFPREG